MKKLLLRTSVFAVALLMLITSSVFAQPGNMSNNTDCNGSYSNKAMTAVGVGSNNTVYFYREQAATTTTSGTRFYEFNSDSYSNHWDLNTPTYNATSTAIWAASGYNGSIKMGATTAGYYYTFNLRKGTSYANQTMAILQTSYNPQTINSVTAYGTLATVTMAGALSSGEYLYVAYSTDAFATSGNSSIAAVGALDASFTGTATLTAKAQGSTVTYYAFTSTSSTAPSFTDAPLLTLNMRNGTAQNTTAAYSTFTSPYVSNASTAWATGSTWVGGAVPSTSSNAEILTGHNVTIGATLNQTGNVTVDAGGTLTIAPGGTTSVTLSNASNVFNGSYVQTNGQLSTPSTTTFNNVVSLGNVSITPITTATTINYGSNSTLKLNGITQSFISAVVWKPSTSSGASVPANVQVSSTQNPTLPANTYTCTGLLTIDAGITMTVTNSGVFTVGDMTGSGPFTASGSTSALVTGGANTSGNTYSGVISGGITLTKNGTGTWIVSNTTNTYTGATTVSGGILRVSGTGGIVASSNGILGSNSSGLNLNGGTIQSNTSGTFSRPITVQATNSGLDAYGSARTISSTITMASGTMNLNVGGTTATSAEGQDLTLSGVIANTAGTLSLTKIGSSTVIVSGNSSYAGTTTINAGTLRLGGTGSSGNTPLGTVSGNTIVSGNGATLDLAGKTLTAAEPLSLNGTGISGGGALMNSSSTTATFSGPITFATDASIVGGTGLIAITGTPVSGTTAITLGGATGGSISTVIAGARNLTKADAGTWTFSGANTYTGTTTISSGTLQLGATDGIPAVASAGAVILAGGTLSSGSTGFSDGNGSNKMGQLQMTSSSTIALGSGDHTLKFTSTASTWTGTLTITGWVGTPGVTAGTGGGKIFIGAGVVLTGTQLTQISFTGYTGCTQLSSGEIVPTSYPVYYSQTTGNYSNSTLSQWNTSRTGGGSSPANFTSPAVFIIQGTGGGLSAPHTVTTSSTWSVGANCTVEVEANAHLVQSSTITFNAATTFKLDANSFFDQSAGGTAGISAGIENWDPTSTITYTANGFIPSANITGTSHPNVVINIGSNNGIGAAWADNGSTPAIAGSLTVTQGAGKYIALAKSTVSTLAFTVAKDVNINTGNLTLSDGTCVTTFNIGGNLTIQSGAQLDASSGGANSATQVVNFTKSGTATFSNSGTIAADLINFNVNNGCTLNVGTSILGGSTGTFNLASGAGIITASTDATGALTTTATGAFGSIQVTGTRTYNTGANYTFNSSSAQVAGNGLTGAASLTTNSGGLTLSAATAVTGTLTLGGKLTLGGNNLTLTSATISGASSSNYIVTNTGSVLRSIASGGGSFAFPIGRSTAANAYSPLTITNTGGTTSVYTVSAAATSYSPTTNGTSAQWSIASGSSTTSTLAFGWLTADAGATLSGTPAAGITYQYNGSSWDNRGGSTSAGTPNTTTVTGITNLTNPLWTVVYSRHTIDGTITAGEYGTHTDGANQANASNDNSVTPKWYMDWDANNLYLSVSGISCTSPRVIFYLDKDPLSVINGGTNSNGTLAGYSYSTTQLNPLPFRADCFFAVETGYRQLNLADGAGGWGSNNTSFGTVSWSSATTMEISVPWSTLTGGTIPSSFAWCGYVAGNGSGNQYYFSIPAENPHGNLALAAIPSGSQAGFERYYKVLTTAGDYTTYTPPFSKNCYVFNSASGQNEVGFGAISVYDFTMNTSGSYISRNPNSSVAWTIGGDLVQNNGTIYMGATGGSAYGTTSVAGNLNISGGTLDLDYNTNPVNVTGGVNLSGGVLALSNTAGGDVKLQGNWNKTSGTLTPRGRMIEFNGTTAQTLTGATTFDYLKINNSAGVTLQTSSPVTVNTNLTIASGKLTIGANDLTYGNNNANLSAGSTNYIVTNSTGQFKRTVAGTATTFPVGNSAYNPISLTNSGTSDTYGVIVADGAITATSPYNIAKTINRLWKVSESVAGGSTLTVAPTYNVGEENNATTFNGGTTPKVGLYNGTSWSDLAATSSGSGPYTFTGNTTFSPSDLTTAQSFALSKDDGLVIIPATIAISSNNPSAGNIVPSSTSQKIGGLQLVVTTNNTTLTGITVNTSGSDTYTASAATDLTNFKLWINTSNSLSGATQLGSTITNAPAHGGSLAFTSGANLPYTVTTATGTYYLIITCDVASGASVGHTITIGSTAFTNITFASATKSGTDPVAAAGTQTIVKTPTVVTGSASSVSTTDATLNGTITANGASTTTAFNWGTTTGYTGGTVTASPSPVTGTSSTGVSAAAFSSGALTPNTLYHFQASGTNAVGTVTGSDASFTTVSNPPSISSGDNTSAAASAGATIFTAYWTAPASQGSETYTYSIEVNSDNTFVATAIFTQSGIASGTTSVLVTGLTSGVTYYYRVKAVNAGGTQSSAWSSPISSGITTTSSTVPVLGATNAITVYTTTTGDGGGTVTSDGGATLTDRGLVYNTTSPAETGGTIASEGGTSVSAFTKQITGLTQNTLYYVKSYATNSVGTAYGSTEVSFTTLKTEPTANGTLSFSNISDVAMDVSFSGGNGDKRIVIAKAGSAPSFTPADITSYTGANAAFGTTSLGGGYLVYNGSGTSFTLTNLTKNTTYYFLVFEYSENSASVANYYATAASGNQITKNPVITTDQTGFTSNAGNVVSGSSSSPSTFTVSGTELVSNITVTAPSGFEVSPDGSTWGTFNITPTSGTVSAVTVYERFSPSSADGAHSGNVALTATSATTVNVAVSGNAIATEPTTEGSITFGTVTTTTIVVNLPTTGNGSNRIIVVKAGSAPTAPTDGVSYTANASIASAGTTAAGSYVVYNGTGSGSGVVTVTGLTTNTTYYFAVYEFNIGTGTSQNYLTPSTVTGSQATTAVSSATDYFRSAATGNWNSNSTWESSPDNTNWIPATLTPDNNANTITVRSPNVVTVTASVSIDDATIASGAQVTVNSGQTLTVANGTGTDLTVNGYLLNSGTITMTGTATVTGASAVYEQTTSSLTLPGFTWASGATLKLSGTYTGAGTQMLSAGSYQNIIWLGVISTSTDYASFGDNAVTVAGKLTASGTGSGALLTSAAGVSLAVAEYEQTSGNVYINRNSASTRSLTVTGNVTVSGGTLNIKTSAGAGAGQLIVGGNLNVGASGTLTNSGSAGSAALQFNGSSPQTWSNAGAFSNVIAVSTITNAGGVTLNTDLTLPSTSSLTLTAANFSIASGKILTLGASSTVSIATGRTLTVDGTLNRVSAGSFTTTGTLSVSNGGRYIHAQAAGTIPSATWVSGSTCEVTSQTSSAPGGIGQSFSNFVWNCSTQSAAINLSGGLTTINGNFDIQNSAGNEIRLTGNTALTLTVGGDLLVSGTNGTAKLGIVSPTGSSTPTINVTGNVSIGSAGTLLSGNTTTIKLAGNWSNSGTFTNANTTIEFNSGTANQTITKTGGETFNNLKINNTYTGGVVTLVNDATVSGTLTFTAGKISTGSNNLIIGTAGTISGAGTGWVIGNLAKQTATSSSPTFTYAIGDASNYTPVALTFTGNNTSGSTGTITATVAATEHPQISTSGIDASKSVNRYWTLTNSGITGFTSYAPAFTYVSGDNDGSGYANYVVRLYNGSSWATTTINGTPTATSAAATGITATTFGSFAIGEKNSISVASNPSNSTVCNGTTNVTFTSTSTSSPAPTVQWERNTGAGFVTVNGSIDGGIYSNFTTTTLNISSVTTTMTGYTYRAVFTNLNGSATSSAATLTVSAAPTTANAGSPQTICVTGVATLAANAPSVGTGAWSVVSGSPSLNATQFSNTASNTSTFTPDGGAGTYTLRWTISNSPCTASTSDVVITVDAVPTTSNAGSPQSICVSGTATLAANSPGVGTGAWSVVSGSPSTSNTQFSSTTSNTAIFTPASGTGTYTLRWTITNGTCSSTSDVAITVNNVSTTSNAGSDQNICTGSTATLAANSPSSGTGAWTVVSGPSTSSSQFSSTTSNTAVFTPAGGTGNYTLRWTITNSPCTASTDDVVISVKASGEWVGPNTGGDWTNSSYWCGGSVPSSSSDVTIPSGVTINIGGSSDAKSVTISSGGTLTFSSGATLTIAGNLTNNGTLTAGSGTINFSAAAVVGGSVATTFYNVITNHGVDFGTSGTTATIGAGGSFTLNSGGYVDNGHPPIYDCTATLIYNTSYSRNAEWTTATSGAGYPGNVWVTNSATLDLPNGNNSLRSICGNLTVDAGAALYMDYGGNSSPLNVGGNITINGNLSLGTSSGGDLKIGGNFTVGTSSTINYHSRAFEFNGTGTQVITKSSGGTLTIPYLLINKASGNAQLSSGTNIELSTTTGDVLQFLNTGGLDLNGQTLTLSGTGGNILANAAASISGASGTVAVTGNKTISGSGSLAFGSNVTVSTSAGLDFGTISTVNGTFRIDASGYVGGSHPPVYGTGATLQYNSGGTYGRDNEWNATSGAGYPYNVQISNSTVLDLGNGGTSTARNTAGSVTIDNGSTLTLNGSGHQMTAALSVASNLNINGTLTLSSSAGGDINVNGNWTRSSTGAFNANDRAVFFNGSGNSTITAPASSSRDTSGCFGGETFPYLIINKSINTASVTPTATNVNILKVLTLTKGRLNLGDSDVVLVSKSAYTADLAPVNTTDASVSYSGSGRFKIQRYIPNPSNVRTWRFLTAPLQANDPLTISQAWMENVDAGNPWPGFGILITGTGGTANGFDASPLNKYSIEWFNSGGGPGGTDVWGYPANSSVALMSHSGWGVFVRGSRSASVSGPYNTADNVILEPKGKINIGDTTVNIVSGRFNVVGNPYPAQIDMSNVKDASNNDHLRFKLWDPKAFTSYSQTGKYVLVSWDAVGGWTTDNSTGTTWITPGTVESSEAFLIDTSVKSATLTFHESDKKSGNNSTNGLSSRPMSSVATFYTKLGYYNSTISDYQYIDGTKNMYNPLYSASVIGTEDYIAALTGVGSIRIEKDGYQLYTDKEPVAQIGDTIYFNTNLNQGNHRLAFYSKNFDTAVKPVAVDNYTGNRVPIDVVTADSTYMDFSVTSDPLSNSLNRFMVVFSPGGVLPVSFSSINAAQTGSKITVNWTIENEVNVKEYIVEKATDGKTFTSIGTITSNGLSSYNWLDEKVVSGDNYYRIVSVGKDGTEKYSQIVKVNIGGMVPSLSVYPNPIVDSKVGLLFTNMAKGKYDVRVLNSLGQIIFNKTIQHNGGSSIETLSLPKYCSKGIYRLEVISENNVTTVINLKN